MRMSDRISDILGIGIVIVIFLFSVGILACCIALPFTTQDTVILTVTDKAAIPQVHTSCNKDGSCSTYTTIQYLIYSNTEVVENTDCIQLWKFGSSELYGKIHVGSTYEFEVYGYRMPGIGMYRNIITIRREII